MIKDIVPSQLQQDCKEWYDYFERKSDITKLESRPNESLNLNVFTKCIVGKTRNVIYFNKRKFPETYCTICKHYSKSINKHFYKMVMYKHTDEFNYEVNNFLSHNKQHITSL